MQCIFRKPTNDKELRYVSELKLLKYMYFVQSELENGGKIILKINLKFNILQTKSRNTENIFNSDRRRKINI